MTVEFTEFVGKAPTLKAIQVTADNIEELAVWLGADSYSVEKILVGGARKVVFNKIETRPTRDYSHPFLETCVGDYILQLPEGIDERLREVFEKFRSVTPNQIANFIKQQHDTGEVDVSAAPYDN